MKFKKSILFLALALTTAAALFFGIKVNNLQNQLQEVQIEQGQIEEKLDDYEQLSRIDSMLLEGNYDTAIQSYNATSLKVKEENKMGIPLRIALAEKLSQAYSSPRVKEDTIETKIDSTLPPLAATTEQVRKFDSLNFSLEKTRVQLARLKKQLQQKSFGEYLKFKSKKGNFMHYVGQVKNGKANGYGIALLDSGSRYEGQWRENQREGEGTFYWPDGEYYVGTYASDKRSGFGTYYWPNGEKYAGQWKEDKRSGTGKFFDSQGDLVAGGEWNDDKLVEINDK
ncbi:MORN repeat protein [Flavobacteriaceae bacterium MAR_2009_75]|nr:MORN repeat protein [Flavobacteriaceae bacterium MAR_2009_75]